MSKTPEQTIAELTDQLQRAQAHNERLVEENEALQEEVERQRAILTSTPAPIQEIHHHHYHAGPSPAEQQRSGKTYNEY